MWKKTLQKLGACTAVVALSAGLCVGEAAAGWIFISDADLTDSATNPGYPSNQSPPTVAAYLQNLLNLASVPTVAGQSDSYGGASLAGLGNPDATDMFLLAFHFGNGNDYWQHTGTFDVFFSCIDGCDTFTLPNTKGISNYRLYEADAPTTTSGSGNASGQAVPEPATMLLLSFGLAGLGFSRRRSLN